MGDETTTLAREPNREQLRRFMLRTARGVGSYIRATLGVGAMAGIQPDRVTLSYGGGTVVFSIHEEPG